MPAPSACLLRPRGGIPPSPASNLSAASYLATSTTRIFAPARQEVANVLLNKVIFSVSGSVNG